MSPIIAHLSFPFFQQLLEPVDDFSISLLKTEREAIKLFKQFDLVSTDKEAHDLYKIVSYGKISSSSDEDLIHYEVASPIGGIARVLRDNYDRLNEKELRALFQILITIVCAKGYSAQEEGQESRLFENIGITLKESLAYTAKYGYKSYRVRNYPLRLSVNTHRDFLNAYTDFLREKNPAQLREAVIQTLPYIANHKELPEKKQLEALSLINEYADPDSLPKLLHNCIVFEHATTALQSKAAEQLFSLAQKREQLPMRHKVIGHLPFLHDYKNILPELRTQSVKVLCDILTDPSDDLSLRKAAGNSLCLWLWTFEGNPLDSTAGKMGLTTIESVLSKEDLELQASIMEEYLFYRIWVEDKDHPLVQRLLLLFQAKLESPKLPLSLKCALAEKMPRGTRNVLPNKNAMPLFCYMMEKIQEKNTPLPLKKIYVEHVVSCYLYESTRKLIGKHFPHLDSIDLFLQWPPIKNPPELYAAAKAANESRLKLASELNSPWIPLRETGMALFIPSAL